MIDAHFHVWQLSRGDYGWLTPQLTPIYRDVTLDDWRQARRGSGVAGGVLVQAAPTLAETRFLLRQAQQASDVLGVVGWVDMVSPRVAQDIADLSAGSKLCSLRPMLQDITDPDWILQPALHPAMQALLSHDLSFDALVKPMHLPRIARLARLYPALRIVLDHGAKPAIAGGQWGEWATGIEQLALYPNVYCKLSGLWTECLPGALPAAFEPHARHLLACFGAGRLLWGSDWPVLELAGSYDAWHAAARGLCDAQQAALVFGETARRAYCL